MKQSAQPMDLSVDTRPPRARSVQPTEIRRQALSLRVLHWSSALLVVLAAITALTRELTEERGIRVFLIDAHRQLGLLVLAALVLRLVLRVRSGLHDNSGGMVLPMRLAAHAAHWLLYGLLLAIPLLGWALTSAHGVDLRVLGAIDLPRLVTADSDRADTLTDQHILASWALLAAVGAHVLAALWHHFVRRDGVLLAMLPRWRLRGSRGAQSGIASR